MQCYPNALKGQLASKIAPVYLLYGNETFLIEESASLIREKIRSDEVEYYKINIQEQKAWQEIFSQTKEQFSLWSKTQLFELQFPAKLSSTEVSALNSMLAEDFSSDTYLILKIGSLTRQQQQAAWFVKAQQQGVTVPHWAPTLQGFSKWVMARAKEKNLHLTSQEIESIVAGTENNALAAAQEIDRLALCSLGNQETLAMAPVQQSQFEVFDLVIAALNQQSSRLLKMLASLKDAQEVPLPLIVWALGTSLRAFLKCTGTSSLHFESIFKQAGIKIGVYDAFSKGKTISADCASSLLSQLAAVDKALKTGFLDRAWEKVTHILVMLSQREF